jgi:uncharacterized protein YqkB
MTHIILVSLIFFIYSNILCLSFNTGDSLVEIPLKIPIWLINIDPDNNNNNNNNNIHNLLNESLTNILPYYSPPGLEIDNVSDVIFKLDYNVNKLIKSSLDKFINEYEKLIKNQPQNKDGYHILTVSIVDNFIKKQSISNLFISSFNNSTNDNVPSLFNLPIVILGSGINEDKLSNHLIYSTEQDECTQSVIGKMAFMDNSAKLCDLSQQYDNKMVRKIYDINLSLENNKIKIITKLASIITSAIQTLTSGSLRYRESQIAEKIICPIIIIKNGDVFTNDSITSSFHPNIELIKKWIQPQLLPYQELILISNTHYVDEHPTLSVSIASSLKKYSSITESIEKYHGLDITNNNFDQVPYVSTAIILKELIDIGDSLCQLLIKRTGHDSTLDDLLNVEASNYQNKDNKKDSQVIGPRNLKDTKLSWSDVPISSNNEKKYHSKLSVIPIFVLSDMHIYIDRNNNNDNNVKFQPLLNKESIVSIDKDSTLSVVLHSTLPNISIYSSNLKKWVQTKKLSNINDVISEGLSKVLTGLSAPQIHLKDSRNIIDTTWTHGIHPFGPYGSLSTLNNKDDIDKDIDINDDGDDYEDILSWAARRGNLVTRVHSICHTAGITSRKSLKFINNLITSVSILKGDLSPEDQLLGSSNNKLFDIDYYDENYFPSQISSHIISMQESMLELNNRIDILRNSFNLKDFKHSGSLLLSLESNMKDFQSSMMYNEKSIEDLLKQCTINFNDENDDNNNNNNKKKNNIKNKFMNSLSRPAYLIIIIIIIIGIIFTGIIIMKKIQEKIESKINKTK